jgi:hypothetical protein
VARATARKYSVPAAPSPLKLVQKQELNKNGYPLEMVSSDISVGLPPPRPLYTPLYDHFHIDLLRRRVRKIKSSDVYQITQRRFASSIVDILGKTLDGLIAYSDGTGITCTEPRKLYEFFESLRVGKTYDFRYIETIRHCGPF